MVKNYILEAQRIIVHLCVCMYTANVLLLYYTDVPCLYCLAFYTRMDVLYVEHDNGRQMVHHCCVCYWMLVCIVYSTLTLLFIMKNAPPNAFRPGELDQWKVWIRAKIKLITCYTGHHWHRQLFRVMTSLLLQSLSSLDC